MKRSDTISHGENAHSQREHYFKLIDVKYSYLQFTIINRKIELSGYTEQYMKFTRNFPGLSVAIFCQSICKCRLNQYGFLKFDQVASAEE